VEKTIIKEAIKSIKCDGYCVLGYAKATFSRSDFPTTQKEFALKFKEIIAFYDPPKANASEVLLLF
jgi:magnesium-transporting ATPase (P-type)